MLRKTARIRVRKIVRSLGRVVKFFLLLFEIPNSSTMSAQLIDLFEISLESTELTEYFLIRETPH